MPRLRSLAKASRQEQGCGQPPSLPTALCSWICRVRVLPQASQHVPVMVAVVLMVALVALLCCCGDMLCGALCMCFGGTKTANGGKSASKVDKKHF